MHLPRFGYDIPPAGSARCFQEVMSEFLPPFLILLWGNKPGERFQHRLSGFLLSAQGVRPRLSKTFQGGQPLPHGDDPRERQAMFGQLGSEFGL
jgi:hypothetical protein